MIKDDHPEKASGEELSEGEVDDVVTSAMRSAGVDPAFIFAYRMTGFIVTSDNIDQLTDEDLRRWRNAVERFRLTRRKE